MLRTFFSLPSTSSNCCRFLIEETKSSCLRISCLFSLFLRASAYTIYTLLLILLRWMNEMKQRSPDHRSPARNAALICSLPFFAKKKGKKTASSTQKSKGQPDGREEKFEWRKSSLRISATRAKVGGNIRWWPRKWRLSRHLDIDTSSCPCKDKKELHGERSQPQKSWLRTYPSWKGETNPVTLGSFIVCLWWPSTTSLSTEKTSKPLREFWQTDLTRERVEVGWSSQTTA